MARPPLGALFGIALAGGLGCAKAVDEGAPATNLSGTVGTPVSALDESCWPGSKAACAVADPACSVGERYCNSDSQWGACVPTSCTGTGGGGGSGGSAGCEPETPVSCVSACSTIGVASCRSDGTPGSCVPPAEACGNGRDDDCDGQVDEDCGQIHDCHGTPSYGSCNSDPGYGDRCDPEDNAKGCAADWFDAWCRRREQPNGGANWDSAVRDWVDVRCDGATVVSGSLYACTDSKGDTWQCETPLVLVFGTDRIELSRTSGVFDLSATGRAVGSDWPSAKTPWLALDRNGNGGIDDGSELFGSGARLQNGSRARNGFEALSELDLNRDGAITESDPVFSELVLWSDQNGNRSSDAGELESLAVRGISRIDLDYRSNPVCDERGNCAVERAGFERHDAVGNRALGSVVDLHLRIR